jgi:nitrate reductase gamma subunit
MMLDLFYGALPYAAALIFAAGLLVIGGLGWLRGSDAESAAAEWRKLFSTVALWRWGVVAVILGHAAIVLFPRTVLAWNGVAFRLYLLEIAGFAAGLAACAGWVQIVRRHFARAGSTAWEAADSVFLSLLGTTLASGLLLAWVHRWASSWGASTLTPYVRSLVSGRPRTDLVWGMPFLVRLHLAASFATVAIVPFTRAGLVFGAFLRRTARVAPALVHESLEPLRRTLSARLRDLNIGQRLWPEED